MTEATPSVRPIIENTGATATAAAETLMKTIAMDGNRINIPIDVRQVTALEFNLERAKLLNRQKEQELEEQAQKIKRLKARNARRWLSIILRGILAVTAIVFVGILWVIARNLFPFHDKHRDREAEKQNPKQTQLEKDTMTYIAKALADKDN